MAPEKPARNGAAFQLNLIGGFELHRDGAAQDLPETAKRVVAFLALHQKPQVRPYVAGSLWPEKPESRAAANLRSALWRLNQPRVPPLVSGDGMTLWLHEAVRVDVRRVQDVGWGLLEPGHPRDGDAQLLADGLAADKDLLFEELLPGWYEDWVLLERERLAELQLHLLDRVVQVLVSEAHFPQAIDTALRMVALDPYRERSQLALVGAYLAEGSLGRARRQFETFDELLRMSFGFTCDISFDDLCARTANRTRRQTSRQGSRQGALRR